VAGLQGGTAPARAFAAFMRYAVKDRPEEEFDTDLQLPEWQLEPDDEFYYGDPGDYFYIDEQGNLIEPGGASYGDGDQRSGDAPRPGSTRQGSSVQGNTVDTMGLPAPPQAADDDFLERATGGALPGDGAPGNVTVRRGADPPKGAP